MRVFALVLAALAVSACDNRPWAAGQNVWRAHCEDDAFDGGRDCSVSTAFRHSALAPQTRILITQSFTGDVELTLVAPGGQRAISGEMQIQGLYETRTRDCRAEFCFFPSPAQDLAQMMRADSMRIRLRTEGREPIIAEVNLIGLEAALSEARPIMRAYERLREAS